MKKTINTSISIIVLLLLTSCNYIKNKNSERKMQQYKEYKDLHEHKGTENYEVVTLFNENSIIKEKLIDSVQHILSVKGRDLKQKKSKRLKIDFLGNILNQGYIYETLKDGTLWSPNEWSNWLINNDTTSYKFIEPFTDKAVNDIYKFKQPETNYKKWLIKFQEYYKNSANVKRDGSSYYLKVDKKWYYMELTHNNSPKDFVEQYPSKINPDEIRMVSLKESMESLMKSGIIKVVNYIEQDSESGVGLNPISFSAGYYMLELHLPKGDTLKFRRYGAMGVSSEMFVYQIPKELGGSDEVFFIEQEPNEMYPNKSFAGFYAIRPKKYKELPEYKPYFQQQQEN